MDHATSAVFAGAGPRHAYNHLVQRLEDIASHTLLALINRFGIASVFFLSGRTKVDGLLTVNDSAYALFRDEYQLPVIPPELAAHLAAYAEHLFPLMLVLGFATRLSALSLLIMTLVIQAFVYPDAWPIHLVWTGALMYLLLKGGGKLSVDRMLGLK